jgi:transposase
MVRPYSLDLRERAVQRAEAGEPVREVGELFCIAPSSVVKWSQRKRQTGSAAAKPMGRRQARSLAGQRDWILGRIAQKPDLTLRELVAELNERGAETSYGSLWRLLDDEEVSFKKKPARRRAGPTRRRASPGPLDAASG